MPKKKISNRLDKLFDEINKEAQTQATGPAKNARKSTKRPAVALSLSTSSETSDPFSVIDISARNEASSVPNNARAPISTMLSTAFRTDDKNWATLKIVDESEQRAWGVEEQMLVKQVADQLSLALENARLFQETQLRAEELSALNQIITSTIKTLELTELLEDLLAEILDLIGFSCGLISLTAKDTGVLTLFAHYNLPEPILVRLQTKGLAGTLCDHVYAAKETLAISDLREGAPVDVSGLIVNGLYSYLGIPLEAKGRVVGTLCVFNDTPIQVTERNIDLSRSVGIQIGFAIENARLFQEAQRRAQEMTAIAEIGREISATLELQAVLERIAIRAQEILHAVSTAVYIPDPKFKTLMAITAIGKDADEIKNDSLVVGQGILGDIAQSRVGEIVNNATSDPRGVTIEGTEDIPDEHLMAAPILSQRILSGLLVVWRVGSGEEFTKSEFEFLESLSQQAAIAVENARLFQETQERAEELAVLNEMARELSAEMNINVITETAHRFIDRLIDTTNFFIAINDERSNQISFPVFIEKRKRINVPSRKPGKGLTEYVIQSKEPLFIPNNVKEHTISLGLEEILVGNKEIALSWLGVPLLVGNKAIGAMAVQSLDTPDLFTEHHKDLMMTIASQVAIALENARLFRDAQSRARREKILREITAHIRATNDPEMIAKAAVRELGQALGVSTFIRLGGSEAVSEQEVRAGMSKRRDQKETGEGGI